MARERETAVVPDDLTRDKGKGREPMRGRSRVVRSWAPLLTVILSTRHIEYLLQNWSGTSDV